MQTDNNSVGTVSPSVNSAPEVSIEDALAWLAKMTERGNIHETPARLAKSAITQLLSVLGPEESRDPQWVLDNIDALGTRLCTRDKADSETVKTYVGRAKKQLADYLRYMADPLAFKARPSQPKAKPDEKKKKIASSVESKPEPQPMAAPGPLSVTHTPVHGKKIRDFPLGSGREIVYSFPEKLTMLELLKFMCHAAPLADDFDVMNPNHQQVFALAKNERTSGQH